jgi:hypothetical protein
MLSLGQVRRNNTPPPPREQTSTIYHELQVLVLSKLQTQGHTQVCPLLPSSIINPPPPGATLASSRTTSCHSTLQTCLCFRFCNPTKYN